jgi:hypothetical protein
MCYSFAVEFNAARPGRRKLSISPAGSGLVLFRTTPPPSIQSPNAGAMLRIGHKRSIEQTALAAEPGCAADSNSDELGSNTALTREHSRPVSGSQPPRKGWPLLRRNHLRWRGRQGHDVGGRERAEVVRKRQLRWGQAPARSNVSLWVLPMRNFRTTNSIPCSVALVGYSSPQPLSGQH